MIYDIQIATGDDEFLCALHGCPNEVLISDLEKTLILMAHDFPGSKSGFEGIFTKLEPLLLDKGFHILRFDFRGCGEGVKNNETYTLSKADEDFRSVIDWAKEEGYERFVYIGEGLGASVELLNIELNVLCMVLLWPVLDLKGVAKKTFYADTFQTKAGDEGFLEMRGCRVEKAFVDELAEMELISSLRDVQMPVLVMHGAQDSVSPVSQLDIVRKHMPAKRIEITTFHDGEYGLPKSNHRKVIFYHVMQFIEKYT